MFIFYSQIVDNQLLAIYTEGVLIIAIFKKDPSVF